MPVPEATLLFHLAQLGLSIALDWDSLLRVEIAGPLAPRLGRRLNKWMKSPPNFERLVLGCIDASDTENWRIFQH